MNYLSFVQRSHMVIDGLQRLTTINHFFNDKFALEGLANFKELEGKKSSELGSYQTELETTTIRCIVLRKDNPKSLIREIFSCLNQGAVELSDQEIRHAIYPGQLDQFLAELGSDDEIKNFGLAENSESVRDSWEPEEQVLRYFAFSDDKSLSTFGSNLKTFLDNYMENNSSLDVAEVLEHRERFLSALSLCKEVFGENVFMNPSITRKRKCLVHYDLIMTTVGELDPAIAREHATELQTAYSTLCQSDEFKKALSGSLQKKGSIQRRRTQWNALLQGILNAV